MTNAKGDTGMTTAMIDVGLDVLPSNTDILGAEHELTAADLVALQRAFSEGTSLFEHERERRHDRRLPRRGEGTGATAGNQGDILT